MKLTHLRAMLFVFAMTVAAVRLAAQGTAPQPTAAPPPSVAIPAASVSPQPAAPVSGPMIQFDSLVYDFGRSPVGQKVPHTYIVTNTGNEVLIISSVHPTCHCTTNSDWTHEIPPGRTGEISVVFDGSIPGQAIKQIEVLSNARNNPHQSLLLKGMVWRPVEVVPSIASFLIAPDTTNEQTTSVHITNQTDVPMVVSNPIISNPAFTARISEIHPGKDFEMVITAHPPFLPGTVPNAFITLNTSLTNTPPVGVTVLAHVQQAVEVVPSQVFVNSLADRWMTNMITIQGHATNLLALSNPKTTDSRIQVEIRPDPRPGVFRLLVELPPGFQLDPSQHAEATVDSNNPRYPVITIPIQASPRRPPPPTPLAHLNPPPHPLHPNATNAARLQPAPRITANPGSRPASSTSNAVNYSPPPPSLPPAPGNP